MDRRTGSSRCQHPGRQGGRGSSVPCCVAPNSLVPPPESACVRRQGSPSSVEVTAYYAHSRQYSTWYLVDAARNLCVYSRAHSQEDVAPSYIGPLPTVLCYPAQSFEAKWEEGGQNPQPTAYLPPLPPIGHTRSYVPVGSTSPLYPLCVIFSLSAPTRGSHICPSIGHLIEDQYFLASPTRRRQVEEGGKLRTLH